MTTFPTCLELDKGNAYGPFYSLCFLNDLEEECIYHGIEGIDIGVIKLFILLYADDIMIFSCIAEGLQDSLNFLDVFCKRWKPLVNKKKTKKSHGVQKGWFIAKVYSIYI